MEKRTAGELIKHCADTRDEEVWQEFHARFERPLLLGVHRTLQRFNARVSDADRQDLVQETYCRLLEGGGRRLRRCKGDAEAAVAAYLGRVAENVVVDFLRGRSAAKRGGGLVVALRRASGSDLADLISDSGSTPEERLLHRERRRRFLSRCGQLVGKRSPQRDLRILYLALFEGCTSREICRQMGHHGLKPGTVDSLIHRLKRRLRDRGMEVPRR